MSKVILLFIVVIALLLLLSPKWYLKNQAAQVTTAETALLRSLGDSALVFGDIPVATILVYKNSVIGKGYNTVKRSGNAGGHAELNAITDAMHTVGTDSFTQLDRDKLWLITTWEPCMMCRGAIIEYRIQHVAVMRSKPLKYWLKQWTAIPEYEWNKQVTADDTLQLHLFMKHPEYELQQDNL